MKLLCRNIFTIGRGAIYTDKTKKYTDKLNYPCKCVIELSKFYAYTSKASVSCRKPLQVHHNIIV